MMLGAILGAIENIGMSDPADRQDGAEQAARDYAWSWFKYHAAQRQTVFRFFMTASGAVIGGYVTTHVSVFGWL
jgi:hypothetical protein